MTPRTLHTALAAILAMLGATSSPADEFPAPITPLFNAQTPREPHTTEETAEALITRLADRPRDRHAREGQFHSYDHYLSFYFEERSIAIEIVDRVAKGGADITVNIHSLAPLGTRDFRAFFRGLSTEAEYHHNAGTRKVGPNRYSTTISYNPKERRALKVGDRMEFEFSPFLERPTNGRTNYYGTAFLYLVGQGIVPWEGRGEHLDSFPLPEKAWLGGRTTTHRQYSKEPEHLFKQLAGNMAPASGQWFLLGRRLHHTDFTTGAHSEQPNPVFESHRDKVGPRFIARSCVACHHNNGRALPPELDGPMFQSVIKIGDSANGNPHKSLGSVLQPRALKGKPEPSIVLSGYTVVPGKYSDGTAYTLRKPNYVTKGGEVDYFSVRLTPQLVGMGLLEAIAEKTITGLADPEDKNVNGISGRVSLVMDPVTKQTRLGRFGYKASKASLRDQIAAAFNTDMGVTTSVFPNLDGEQESAGEIEVSDRGLSHLYRYIATLGITPRRDLDDQQALRGERLFSSASCVRCHLSTLKTSAHHPFAELRNQTIHPYTDLLLHDMGPGLADNLDEGGASGSEWRTAPLWSIGLTKGVSGGEGYLHDGRARTLEEAILWHGGEAESSKEQFRQMSAEDRAALIKFLKSL